MVEVVAPFNQKKKRTAVGGGREAEAHEWTEADFPSGGGISQRRSHT